MSNRSTEPDQNSKAKIVFFASTLSDACANALRKLIYATQSDTISDGMFSGAVKELTCMSIYLSLVEQGGNDAPEMAVGFLNIAYRALDRLVSGDSSADILQTYEFIPDALVTTAVAEELARKLEVQEKQQGLAQSIEAFLKGTIADRLDFVMTAMAVTPEEAATYLTKRYALA